MNNTTYEWYQKLVRPEWAPPNWLFGPVWTVLYLLIIVSYSKVFQMGFKKEIPMALLTPFVINIFSNVLFTPIQFGLKNNFLAAIDITVVLVTIILIMITIYPYSRWISLIQIPYLLWVSFATVLQFTITYLNK